MARVSAATLILLTLTAGWSTAIRKEFLQDNWTYEEVLRCPEAAQTDYGSLFALRTRTGQGCITVDRNCSAELIQAKWVDADAVVFLIHDSDSNAWDPWVQASQYYLAAKGFNVFAFNWKTSGTVSSTGRRFTGHAANVKAAATDLAAFIRQLIQHGRARQEDIHLVGFGLGAHLAGFAGKKLQLEEGTPSILIGRITGLDPTGSGFENALSTQRLNSTDAKLVVVIHTNGFERREAARLGKWEKFVRTRGIWRKIGHFDFYPNGGMLQPGCSSITDASHRKAVEFFYAALQIKDSLYGLPCNNYESYMSGKCGVCSGNCIRMGFDIKPVNFQPNRDLNAHFIMEDGYYLTTPSKPFFNFQLYLIQLDAKWNTCGKYSAKLRTTGRHGQVKKLSLTDKPIYNKIETIAPLDFENLLELKFTTSPPTAVLNSVDFQLTNVRTAKFAKFMPASTPTNGQYMRLKEETYTNETKN